MKSLIKIVQFILNEIIELVLSIWTFLMGIGFYVILPILTFFALLALVIGKNWNGIIGIVLFSFVACLILGIIKLLQIILNFIVGILLNESGENKRIYKTYEQWYENSINQEYERRRRAQEEYQRQQQQEYQRKQNEKQRFWDEQYKKWQDKEYSNSRQEYSKQQQQQSRQQYERQNNNNSRFKYQNTNDGGIIQKFEKYLDVLEIDKNGEITERIIHKAFLKKMKVVHPDKNLDKDTTAQAQELKAMEDFLKAQLEYYLMQRRKRQ